MEPTLYVLRNEDGLYYEKYKKPMLHCDADIVTSKIDRARLMTWEEVKQLYPTLERPRKWEVYSVEIWYRIAKQLTDKMHLEFRQAKALDELARINQELGLYD